MTRKDYKLIAECFSNHFRDYGPDVEVEGIVYRMSEMLAQENPRFDKAKFREACGV